VWWYYVTNSWLMSHEQTTYSNLIVLTNFVIIYCRILSTGVLARSMLSTSNDAYEWIMSTINTLHMFKCASFVCMMMDSHRVIEHITLTWLGVEYSNPVRTKCINQILIELNWTLTTKYKQLDNTSSKTCLMYVCLIHHESWI